MSLENQVLAFMQEKAMTAPGDKVLCALSGGGDSMALTHLLHRLAPGWVFRWKRLILSTACVRRMPTGSGNWWKHSAGNRKSPFG